MDFDKVSGPLIDKTQGGQELPEEGTDKGYNHGQ